MSYKSGISCRQVWFSLLRTSTATVWTPRLVLDQKFPASGALRSRNRVQTCSGQWWDRRPVDCRFSPSWGRPGMEWDTRERRGPARRWTGTVEPLAFHWNHSETRAIAFMLSCMNSQEQILLRYISPSSSISIVKHLTAMTSHATSTWDVDTHVFWHRLVSPKCLLHCISMKQASQENVCRRGDFGKKRDRHQCPASSNC